MLDVLIGGGLHACIPFTSLAGVLLDGAIGSELQLPVEAVVLSNSLIFAAWIPGALVGGQVSDTLGRKPACIGFSMLSTLALVAIALLPPGSEALLYAARATSGFAIGAFMAPAYALLLESRMSSAKVVSQQPLHTLSLLSKRQRERPLAPSRLRHHLRPLTPGPAPSLPHNFALCLLCAQGAASFAWSLGYVASIAAFAALHLAVRVAAAAGLFAGVGMSTWRLEQLLLALFVTLCIGATREWVVESPRWLLASGDAPRSLASLEAICSWNGVNLTEALHSDHQLAALAAAAHDAKKCIPTAATSARSRWKQATEAPPPPAEATSWGELFSASGMLSQTLGLGALQLSWNIAYYALAFSAGTMSDQLLLYAAACTHAPAYLLRPKNPQQLFD